MVTKRLRIFALALALCACGGEKDNTTDPADTDTGGKKEETRVMTNHAVYDGVSLPDELWTAPEYFREESLDRNDRQTKGSMRAIYYRSDYMGEESYAFAYLGIPDGVTADNKAPAVLLVHGGGGTAYWQWVSEWVNRGYVALAMDLEGHVPKPSGTSDNAPADLYDKSEYNTPHNQNYADAAKPIEQTWMYYAVSTAIRGNSLLHSLPEVDKYKVGVCGVSWGGVITSIITGYDDRFAFSAPIYCSLNISESGGNLAGYYKNHPAAKVWDTDEGIARVNTPIFLLAMDNDPNAYVDGLSLTVSACKNASIAFVPYWAHSHSHAFARQEPYAFADSIVKGGKGLVKISGNMSGSKGTLTLTVPEGVTVKSADIAYTSDDLSSVPSWRYSTLKITDGKINYEITEEMHDKVGGVSWFYIYVTDSLNRVVSTVATQAD